MFPYKESVFLGWLLFCLCWKLLFGGVVEAFLFFSRMIPQVFVNVSCR